MNKAVRIVIAVVIIIWIFATGLVTGTFIARRSYKKEAALTQQATGQSYSGSTGINIDIVTDVPTTSQPNTSDFTFELPSDYNSFSTYEYESEK